MIIYLDTNIFYKNWYFDNPHFKYLFHFINNEGHTLLISKLVIQEIENIRNREIKSTLEDISKSMEFLNKRLLNNVKFDDTAIINQEYDFEKLLKEFINYSNIRILDYIDVKQEEVVEKALYFKKPFQEEEKGYRDTMIWLSLLDFIKTNNIKKDVIFISSNKNDFFEKKKKTISFHSDLLEDINKKEITTKIIPFETLFSFVKNTIDEALHSFDHSNPNFEHYLEVLGEEYLGTHDYRGEVFNFRSGAFTIKFSQIINVHVDMFEGMEDPEVLGAKKLDEDSVYVNFKYNLRRVTLTLEISKEEYFKYKDDISNKFYGTEFQEETVLISTIIRPYFDVSFIYDTLQEEVKDYSVDYLYIG
ncbi:conserved hypothetical protein [Aliarcobacter butzleri RM4018]|uniref:DUF4935 domain-containing protein n=1 Tax=Aliarcobacter butzleri (strain RM4018) TaxID=367737 RepID=A8EUG1_ALIB4|nr:PIN domain-containing protein [Aliarcobacter butzleri]ABV67585.1 conserved hypothetical protein [Aliarcobacter butzleri RM4018]GGT74708.1 DUF4935 domain-containing protein [Aliarcobacter butzleri]SNV29415.1 Uncharacterised protein [Aliarcobacter butzleri]